MTASILELIGWIGVMLGICIWLLGEKPVYFGQGHV